MSAAAQNVQELLISNEEDIALDINDFGELKEVYQWLIADLDDGNDQPGHCRRPRAAAVHPSAI